MIKKGTWVEIEKMVLAPEDRSASIPQETKEKPLMVWARGKCMRDCEIGEEVEITTSIGRTLSGKVVEEKPGYYHSFGPYVEEIEYIGPQAKEILDF